METNCIIGNNNNNKKPDNPCSSEPLLFGPMIPYTITCAT